MLYPSDAEAMEMYRRKIDLLEKQSSSTFAGNTLAAALVTVLCWSVVNKLVLSLWLVAIFATVFVRWRKVAIFKKRAVVQELDECYRYCARSIILNGCIWALLFTYIAFILEPGMLVYPFIALCSITSGSCLLYNAYFNPFRNYAIPALLLPSAALLMSGEPIKMWIGVVVICWFVLMYSLSGQLQRFLASISRYETENIALIRDLEFQKEKTARLNEELQLKTEIIHRLAKTDTAQVVDAQQRRSNASGN